MNFVYIVKDYNTNDQSVHQYEVGIVQKKLEDFLLVQFVNIVEPIRVPVNLLCEFDPQKTGDQFDRKVCNRCHRLLPTDQFQINQNGINNRKVRRPSCNDCRDIIDGKSVSSKEKAKWDRNKPHLVVWECPICRKRTIPGLTSKVVLDHNHKTGTPNGWICDSCNTGLGRFNDDVDVMKQAISYLNDHNTTK